MIIYAPGQSPDLPSFKFYIGTPKECTLVFSEPEWAYYRIDDGSHARQDGVTTVLHRAVDRSAPISAWSVKMAMARLKVLLTERGHIADPNQAVELPLLYESILDGIIKEAKAEPKAELDRAGDIGSIAHDWLERVIKAILDENTNRRMELLAKFPENEKSASCDIAAVDFMVRHKIKWISTERKVYSLRYKVAGTLDGLCLASSCDDPLCCPTYYVDRLTLADWKSSNFLYATYFAQTAIYAEAYFEEMGQKVEQRFIIRLGKDDGEFETWHTETEEEFQHDLSFFLNALALCRDMDILEERISAVRDRRREAAAAVKAAERAVKCLDADGYKGKKLKKGCNGGDTIDRK